jgi:transketolase
MVCSRFRFGVISDTVIPIGIYRTIAAHQRGILMATSAVDVQQLTINTIRTLAMDAVQAANSGHPGTPMALAPVVYTLWTKFMKFDPENPQWAARDRFVLSCGHASMLLYSTLHLAGVKKQDGSPAITLENIRNFRQLHSPCAGHPEFGEAPGIETTTGPLGQGLANSVGMAAASKWLTATYDPDRGTICDYNVFALCSDGDMMEGVGCEAASLAGHWKLDNLCWIYDDNKITIEGRTELAFSENVGERFRALGWNVVRVDDANDLDALESALGEFQQINDRPTLIIVKSIIGFGAPNKQDTAAAHGAPLGEDEIALAKQTYDWPFAKFQVPEGVYEHLRETLGKRGKLAFEKWQNSFAELKKNNPKSASQLEMIAAGQLPNGWQSTLPAFAADTKGMATRVSSAKVLNAVAGAIPWFIGGSADLAESNKSLIEDAAAGHFSAREYAGRNFHFGIREHAMAAICNGLSLSGIRPYCATFFVFTDYLRPAMRLAALMRRPVLYILTHDSIGLGEDGPTHQPVEHLAACRAIPNLLVMRPADANEVAACYQLALLQSTRPTALVLSRQNMPTLDPHTHNIAEGVSRGGYVLIDAKQPAAILIGTGSELCICVQAAHQLAQMGINVRVVSMPCCEIFDEQPHEYRESILPTTVPTRIAVEAGIKQGWEKYLGEQGQFIGMSSFGASAPFERLYDHFGITAGQVVAAVRASRS